MKGQKRGRKHSKEAKSSQSKKKQKTKTTTTEVDPDSNWKALLQSGKIKRKINRYTETVKKTRAENAKRLEEKQEKAKSTPPEVLFKKRSAQDSSANGCKKLGVGVNMDSRLARVCVLNEEGEVILDKFCRPKEQITDYRTRWSGIRSVDLINAESIEVVQQEVADLVRGRTLIGHSIQHDLEALYINHPKSLIRDTSHYRPFKKKAQPGSRALPHKLKYLAWRELNWKIQDGEHDPYIDARAALELYRKHSKVWEQSIQRRREIRTKARRKKLKMKTTTEAIEFGVNVTTDVFSHKTQ